MKLTFILMTALLITMSSCAMHVKGDMDYVFDPQVHIGDARP